MHTLGLIALLSTAGPALSQLVYAAVADGTVQVLSIDNDKLSLKTTIKTCGASPSWLTKTSDSLFCSDESTPGSLTQLSRGTDGSLVPKASIGTDGGDVFSVVYGAGKFMALPHFGHSSLTNVAIPIQDDTKVIQTLAFPFPGQGPNPRQDKGQPHQAINDPSDRFIFSPDLGADVIRVLAIDKKTGKLTEQAGIELTPGTGPRHVDFFRPDAKSSSSSTFVYLAAELSNKLSGFRMDVNGTDGAASFAQIVKPQSSLDNRGNAAAALMAEVRVHGNTLTVSNRGDATFGLAQDSLTVYTIGEDGSLSNQRLFPSGGNFPRSFDISEDGGLVVVGNQLSQNVVVMQRDTKTGAIGKVVGDIKLSGQVINVLFG